MPRFRLTKDLWCVIRCYEERGKDTIASIASFFKRSINRKTVYVQARILIYFDPGGLKSAFLEVEET
ncbi:hypothetical protein M513_02233 [Trichuris suis]|uniref:Uncharacterized protein n=1 Tax=Trichuris suis TaxID=68888 RepID=A0A085MID0_9BILA|nr:hypothetical protein M513_02233 [Trichuris suis]